MARKNRNMDRFSGGNGKPASCLPDLHFHPVPAQWLLFTDGKGASTFFHGPLLLAGTNPQLPMKKSKPQVSNVVPLLDDETRTSVRNLLFGPKVLSELKILAQLAHGANSGGKPAAPADAERLAA